jgi:hypothetical protein
MWLVGRTIHDLRKMELLSGKWRSEERWWWFWVF